MNIFDAIKIGDSILKKNGIKSYKLDSEILMSQVLDKSRVDIILNSDTKLSDKETITYNNLIKQRSKKKPIAHLTGKKEFWKYEFYVTKDVLIPRPDTEIIVEQVIKLTKKKSRIKILDIGIGSGCILLSILKEKKGFYGTGVDICKKTLDICKANVKELDLIDRVKLFKSDIDNFNYGKYDLIVSNPPYIKKSNLKCLEKDISFEPKQALDGGLDGLLEIRKVINKSSELIKRNGHFIIEIGFDQKNKVKKILRDKGFYIKKTVKDLSNYDRCIVSIKT